MMVAYDINKFLDIEKNLSRKKNIDSKQIATPDPKTFDEIFKKAQSGNEMATVQILEWTRRCKPADATEKQVLDKANNAVKRLFNCFSK